MAILDDDPTGTQAAKDIDVLLSWDTKTLRTALFSSERAFFVLLNSRALPETQAAHLVSRVVHKIGALAQGCSVPVRFVLRGDSTLRGHYPSDVQAARSALNDIGPEIPWTEVHVPAFIAGGRITIGDTQWVVEGRRAKAVATTEFARDPVFAFVNSDLKHWIQEKTSGRILASDVMSIGLEDIRSRSIGRIVQRLAQGGPVNPVVANAACNQDITALTAGVLAAELLGGRYLFHTGASFAAAYAGAAGGTGPGHRQLSARLELPASPRILLAVGSHVDLTTRQLDVLKTRRDVVSTELRVSNLSHGGAAQEVARVALLAASSLAKGAVSTVFTSRSVATGSRAQYQAVAPTVAHHMAQVVAALSDQYDVLITKGGITASIILTDALRADRARVIGQLLPGVPVWKVISGQASSPKCIVIFPGNVGNERSLCEAVRLLKGARQ